MEWMVPLLAFGRPRRYFNTRQARQVIGCSTTEAHNLINDGTLHAHRVGGERGHWRIHPISLVHYMFTQSNAAAGTVPLLAASAYILNFVKVLPLSVCRVLLELLTERVRILEHTMQVTGLEIPAIPLSTLEQEADAQRATPAGQPRQPTTTQTQLL